MRNLDTVAEQLFNEIRGRYSSVTTGDAEGNLTSAPSLARFYEFDFKSQNTNLGKVSVSLDEKSGVTIMYNKDFTEEVGDEETKDWFNFLKQMRMFSKKRLLNFEVRDINRTNFTKRDYASMAVNRGETQMAESKMYGTHKTSFQKFGSAKLSIKHTANIIEGESRNKKIGSLFIENSQGEKFKYPFKHLSGARAMAIHVSEGGHPYDDFGKHITSLSEELSNLRKFKTYMGRSSVMAESLAEHMGTVNERITTVKKRIQTLQKPIMYKEALEEFVVIEESEVPADVASNWIDQLTIKQFNEDLKDVFPYIYKLVGETTQADELHFDDLIAEADAPATSPRPRARPQVYDTPAQAIQAAEEEMSAQPGQVKTQFEKGEDYTIHPVQGGFVYKLAPTVDIGAGAQTDTMPNGSVDGSTRGPAPMESQIDAAFDNLLGQFADNFTAQVEGESHTCESCGCDTEDPDDGCDCSHTNEGEKRWKQTSMDPKLAIAKFGADNVKVKKGGLNNGDDMVSVLTDDDTVEGNPYAHAVRQAKMNGKKKGDTIPHPDKDEDDIVIEKDKTPLGEFILSYYDRQQGVFPKGETAVLTMVEKSYGDKFIKPASQFIERLGQVYEKYQARKMADFTRIQELAGLK